MLYIFCQSCVDIQSSCALVRPAAPLGGDTQRSALSEMVRGTSASETVRSNVKGSQIKLDARLGKELVKLGISGSHKGLTGPLGLHYTLKKPEQLRIVRDYRFFRAQSCSRLSCAETDQNGLSSGIKL
eukprot:200192-Amphidinium_carterae.1